MKHPVEIRVSRARLRKMLDYNAYTGVFTWLVKPCKNIPAGVRAGSLLDQGYRGIRLDGVLYREQHLAWFYHYGHWPVRELDHINHVRDDNRLCNLRAASPTQNRVNSRVSSRSKLGVKGVRMTSSNRFSTHVAYQGAYIYLGTYDTIEEAKAVHATKHRELHGAFSCTSA